MKLTASLVVCLLAVVALVDESQAFWSKKSVVPIHCDVRHELVSTVETLTATKLIQSEEWTTQDFYAPTYVTDTLTHLVTSFIPNIITAYPNSVTIRATELKTVTEYNRAPVISTTYLTVYHTEVSFTTLVSAVVSTLTVTTPVTQALQIPLTVTTYNTLPITLQVTTTSTVHVVPASTTTTTSTITATLTSTLCYNQQDVENS
ncbi:hypothetical protein Pmani_018921 [Petrolisthes manimaculis]|uniref:Uncharacterized protein n=1 Tax=Petrolisthes manimaculis TaxID=1843537 RepID=A0AAE1U885_9EUCA|nr:hypothetical protein Pmani_018921 [Petrolisthes manimaculis]